MAAQEHIRVSWPGRKVTALGQEPVLAPAVTLESLVARQYGFIFRVLRALGLSRTDAEDAAQQVFMVAARKIDSITPERARSFLYGTAVRVAGSARRRVRRRREVLGDADEAAPSRDPGPEEARELAEARELLFELLAQLPEKLRRAVILAEIEQLEIAEVAALEGIPVGTAASRLRLARARLRELADAGGAPGKGRGPS